MDIILVAGDYHGGQLMGYCLVFKLVKHKPLYNL